MSEPLNAKPIAHLSRRALFGAAAVGALALAGCQVSPLYSDRTGLGGTSGTANALSNIEIDPPADRLTQLVRNELVFGLDSQAPAALYRLSLRASSSSQSLGITSSGASFAQSVQVRASYRLFRTGQSEALLENTVSATASYDTSGQRFANQRALIDAQERASREVAQLVKAQLAAFFATNR